MRKLKYVVLIGVFMVVSIVRAQTIPPTHIVTTEWLAKYINNPNIVLIDVRSQSRYLRGHLPGAVNIDWKDFTDDRNGIPRFLPTPARFEELMRYAGVNNNSIVIVYASTKGTPKRANDASRALWTMYYFGMDNIAILDGGITKWLDEGRPIEKGLVMKKRGTFKITKVRRNVLTVFDDILVARYTGLQIVDIRPPWMYMGETKDAKAARYGHIPGAYNYFIGKIYRKVGHAYCFPTKDAALKLAQKVGLDLNKPMAVYCNAGHCGAGGWIILKFIAGAKDVSVYDGSLYEYTRMPVNMKLGPARGTLWEIDRLK